MAAIEFPLASKWACLFSTKARARYLDVFALYADGSFDRYPRGSICLDAPLILLHPEHPDGNKTRPSNIAQACDLFTDPACYKFLRLIEDDIITRSLFRAINPMLYVIGGLDDQLLPSSVHAMDYGEALAQLRDLMPAPSPYQPAQP